MLILDIHSGSIHSNMIVYLLGLLVADANLANILLKEIPALHLYLVST